MEKSETIHPDPIAYFNRWLREPVLVKDRSVAGIIAALDAHPSSSDESRQNYVMPPERCHEEGDDRYVVYSENQDVYYFFVYAGDELKTDPPVYLASSLDLPLDHGVDPSQIIGGNHCLVAQCFTDFLWLIWGQYIGVRFEAGDHLASGVSGLHFKRGTRLETGFRNPLGIEFPAGYDCYFSEDVIYIPQWGAAFLNEASKKAFLNHFNPQFTHEWTVTGDPIS
ncbi:MAG TPA: hypothetical protein VGH19_11370 [Verrucomicrobiae bacterium]